LLLLGPTSFVTLVAADQGSTPSVKQNGPVTGDGITFFTEKTQLWQGRSQIICFQVAQPAVQDRYYSFQVDEKLVHLLIPPRILKGEKMGYLRVQAQAEGKTRIGIENAKLDVEIVKDGATQTIAELNPQIVTPASGANVWGEFAVGVEQLGLADAAQLPAPVLLLPNGKEVAGHAVPDQKPSPHARWAFTVNASDLAPGSNKLIAVQKDETGREIRSNAIYVDAITPTPATMMTGLCQDQSSSDRAPNDGPTPPKVINDDKYGQGMIVDTGEEGKSWCLPVWVDKKGEYQMLVTARGEFGSDALATVAVTIDEQGQPETTSRLATTEWQRVPVGRPFTLEPGGHILSVRIRNAFSHGPDDSRSLYFQKYEFARIDHDDAKLAASGGSEGAGSPMMAMAMMAGGNTGGADDLHVTFAENLDRQVVTGAIDIEARCWRPDRDHTPPPRVELYVNKRLVATQRSDNPNWTIDPAAFAPGFNLLELKAVLPSGAWVKSVPLRVELPQDFPAPGHPFRPTVVFTTYDSGLCSSMNPPLKQDNSEMATFYANAESTVKIPENLSGKYKVVIEARGDDFKGPPIMAVNLKSDGKETKLGDLPVGPKMGPVQAGQVVLGPGEKELTIAYTNDAYEKDKGDRNLYVKSVRFVPIDDIPDKTPPVVGIAYSPKECELKSVDAVVARVMDNQRVAGVDLLVDDQPQHLDQRPLHGLGPVVFPLLTRELKAGHHRLKVVARDDAGNQGFSPEVSFTVSAAAATAPSKYERAIFLLNRFGYGPEPGEVAAILTMGEKPWLESRLAQDVASPGEENEQEWMRGQFPNDRDGGEVARGAVEYLLTEPNPVRARFVMWTENHFSTWMSKDGASSKAREHQSFLELGPVPFFDLLFTSATSPAMLMYLDQRNSVAHHLNENYAREIMELHTLGVKGGYTQKDVTTLADLLTGWTLNDEAPGDGSGGELDRFFGFDPRLSSGDACRILGVEFPGVEPEQRFDRIVMALELLSAHPSCAAFISRKLCEQYVSDPAPPKLVDDLAQVYLKTGGDVPAMLKAMAAHPVFWASSGKVTSSIDFGVRAARMARSTNAGAVTDLLSASGMGMFDRATPDGYPEDNGFSVNSNAMLQRWRFAKAIQGDFLNAGLIPTSLRPTDTGWNPDVTQHLVDLAAFRMTGNVLSDASNDAAQKLLAGAPPSTDVRLHALATLICQLPESSLK
jgi:Protein of unknown function (DUF1800)/Ca-dependent carbohydrate-binding module xylan-binding